MKIIIITNADFIRTRHQTAKRSLAFAEDKSVQVLVAMKNALKYVLTRLRLGTIVTPIQRHGVTMMKILVLKSALPKSGVLLRMPQATK